MSCSTGILESNASGFAVGDALGRPLRDLRVSVTDRCNFRCPYCMPAEVFGPGHPFLKDPELMSLPELTRILRAFVQLGVEKIRLTGESRCCAPMCLSSFIRLNTTSVFL